MSNKGIKIPIVRCGKDICRIIFTEDKSRNGKFDIKVDFLGNLYSVAVYKLFQEEPETREYSETKNSNITYHHGKNNKPITIHLKNENSNPRYMSLLTGHILPPNRNTMFPIPLLKLEIPDSVLKESDAYVPKNRHYPLDVKKQNVIELYMANKNFDSDRYFSDKYNLLLFPQMVMPIEYFATYSIQMNSAKYDSFIPKGKPETRGIWIRGLSQMNIYASVYTWEEVNSNINKLRITFLENELSEEILLCTLLDYPQSYYLTGHCDSLRIGNANLRQLRNPTYDENSSLQASYLPNSTVSETIRRGQLNFQEAMLLSKRASEARKKLYDALLIYQKES